MDTSHGRVKCVVPKDEVEGRLAFANVSKLGTRLDIMLDPDTNLPGGVDSSDARQDRVGVSKPKETDVGETTHGPGFAGLSI
jgi:hypothetical protein